MSSVVQKHPHLHDAVQQTIEAATNPVATGVSGGTGIFLFLHNEITTIVGVLTALVLLCQLLAWGYKFYKWFAGRKPKLK